MFCARLLVVSLVMMNVGVLFAADKGAPARPYGWRGDGTGRFDEDKVPLTWDAKKNVLWKVKVGVNRYGSPIVVAGKVIVLSEPAQIVCIDGRTGEKLWERSCAAADLADMPGDFKLHEPNADTGNVSSTPTTDGRFVYVLFASGVVACYDLEGQRKWAQVLEQPSGTAHGLSASPLLVGDKLFVMLGHLIAMDPASGKVLWRNKNVEECYGTPARAKIGQEDVLICPGGQIVKASDGTVLQKGLGSLTYGSPLVSGSDVYAIDKEGYALRLPDSAEGKLKLKPRWEMELEGEYFVSPVLVDGLLFTCSNQGSFSIIDAKDGKVLESKELDIASAGSNSPSAANIYAGLLAIGKNILLSNDAGETLVIEAGREYKEIGRNKLPEGSGATPAVADGRVYIRGREHLYCIGFK